MTRRSGWQQRRGERKGARRLPEQKRRRVLKRYPSCQLAFPDRCTGVSTEVHHVIPASEFINPNDPRIDAEQIDGRPQLIGVCSACHKHETSRQQWSWKRQPEPHPGVLP
jgi:5-methylcytosine-specific restriction protein A